MTNEELKEKICEIIAPYVSAWGEDERIADALIAAGCGDVKEAEHRAKVAEKALKHAVNSYIAHWETASKKRWWYKYFLREAEKELAEEGKDETFEECSPVENSIDRKNCDWFCRF